MANTLGRLWKEHVAELSIVLLIIGLVTLIFGLLGMVWTENLIDTLGVSEDLLSWSLYILIVGFILTLTGAFYFYDFMRNKRFLLEELETKKRSEFIKNHAELKNAARHLPTKYQDMLAEKEDELHVK